MNDVHILKNSLPAKVARRATPYFSRRVLKFKRERPLISFTFDDCPVSAVTGGINPLAEQGWQSTVYVASGLIGKTNHHGPQLEAEDILTLHKQGHEIGCHTFSHLDAQTSKRDAYLYDVKRNQQTLADIGLPPSRTFAYPYGVALPDVKKKLALRFEGLRGIYPGLHVDSVDLNQIKSIPIFSGAAMEKAKNYLKKLETTPGWITFFTHDISDTPSAWGCTPGEIQSLIDIISNMGAEVMPVDKAIDTLRGSL